jgi:hypothetical protein
MDIKSLTHEKIKELYLEKMKAIANKDWEFVMKLKNIYPELFDKAFMYQILQAELKSTGETIPDELDTFFREMVRNSKKIKIH